MTELSQKVLMSGFGQSRPKTVSVLPSQTTFLATLNIALVSALCFANHLGSYLLCIITNRAALFVSCAYSRTFALRSGWLVSLRVPTATWINARKSVSRPGGLEKNVLMVRNLIYLSLSLSLSEI